MDKITFKDLGLSKDVLKGIEMMGYVSPSPIQEKSIPVLLEGKDIIGQAQTGTGKTLAFGSVLLSTIEKNNKQVQALILSPTRELALQIHEELKRIGKYTDLSIVSVFGGSEIDKQIKNLKRGADIVVGTPGRVQDLMRRKVLKIDHIQWMVLDEADEMLNMGFIEDIENILQATPAEKRTILFSATMPSDIKKIASNYMQEDYMHIQIKSKTKTASTVSQYYFEAAANQKFEALCRILDSREMENTIIFCKTKRSVDEIVAAMQQKHYNVEAMHGDLSQNQRMNTLKRFKSGQVQYLVATDVAARGIDVDNISHVINYEMPQDEELYIHRIGRTGRAGRTGMAFSFVVGREVYKLKDIRRYCKAKIKAQPIPSLNDVTETRVEKIFDRIDHYIEDQNLNKYIDMVEEFVNEKDYTAMDVAAAFLAEILGTADGKDAGSNKEDFGDTGAEEGMVRLFINIGKKQGIRPGDILGAIAGESGISGNLVGTIDLYDKYTFVEVPREVASDVLEAMKNVKIKGKSINVEPANRK